MATNVRTGWLAERAPVLCQCCCCPAEFSAAEPSRAKQLSARLSDC